jgi:hypothetical protein
MSGLIVPFNGFHAAYRQVGLIAPNAALIGEVEIFGVRIPAVIFPMATYSVIPSEAARLPRAKQVLAFC